MEDKSRPKLDPFQQVEAMKSRGIRFDVIDEATALTFLRDKNFFFKLKAFAKNFDKYQMSSSGHCGEYIDLDFSYLVELSRLDKDLRFFILEASLDIEHFLKVRLNAAMMDDEGCDGYNIVATFLDFDASRKARQISKAIGSETAASIKSTADKLAWAAERIESNAGFADMETIRALDAAKETVSFELQGMDLHHIENSIARLDGSSYSRNLARKYGQREDMAYWNLLELISFGDIIAFYKYYFIDLNGGVDPTAKRVKQLLFPTKTLRNAAAHNSCLLNGLRDRIKKPVGIIPSLLVGEYGLDKELVSSTRRVPLIHDFSALLISYDAIVCSDKSRETCAARLHKLDERMGRNRKMFVKQPEVAACVSMICALAQGFERALEKPNARV